MAQRDLNYAIALTVTNLESLVSLKAALNDLRQVAQAGAEFELRINDTSLQNLKKKVQEAVGEVNVQVGAESKKGSGAGLDTATITKIDSLITRLDRVAAALEKRPMAEAAPTRPEARSPFDSDDDLGLAATAKTSIRSIESAASAAREAIRTMFKPLSLGADVNPVSADKDLKQTYSSQRNRRDSGDDPTIEAQLTGTIKNRNKIISALGEADKQLVDVLSVAEGAQRQAVSELRRRIKAALDRANDKALFSDTTPSGVVEGIGKKSRTNEAREWAREVAGLVGTSIDEVLRQLPGMSTQGGARRVTSSGGTQGLSIDATTLTSSLKIGLIEIAPRLGQAIGAEIAKYIKPSTTGTIDTFGETTNRDAQLHGHRPAAWARSGPLSEIDREATLRSMAGSPLAAAIQKERLIRKELELEQAGLTRDQTALQGRIAAITNQIRENKATLDAVESAGANVPSIRSDPQYQARLKELRNRDTLLGTEYLNARNEQIRLDETRGARVRAKQQEYDQILLERNNLEAGGAPNRAGFGTEFYKLATEFDPNSTPAKTAFQVTKYLRDLTAQGGYLMRNMAVSAADMNYTPLAPQLLPNTSRFILGNSQIKNLQGKLSLAEVTADNMEADLEFARTIGDASPEEVASKKALLDTARKEVVELKAKLQRAIVLAVQRSADDTAEKLANFPGELVAPGETVDQQNALLGRLREAARGQVVQAGSPLNEDIMGQVGMMNRLSTATMQNVFKNLIERARGGEDLNKLEQDLQLVRQLPLLEGLIPTLGDIQAGGGTDFLVNKLLDVGYSFSPAFNLSKMARMNQAIRQPTIPDTDIGSGVDEYGNNWRVPLTPLTIQQRPAGEQPGLWQLLNSQIDSQGLRFAPQSERRRASMERWIKYLDRTIQTLQGGELPGYVPLGDVGTSMFKNETDFRSLVSEFQNRALQTEFSPEMLLELERLSANAPKIKINPSAYGDVIQSMMTARALATQEMLGGGVYYRPGDEWAAQRINPEGILSTTSFYRGSQRVGNAEYDPVTRTNLATDIRSAIPGLVAAGLQPPEGATGPTPVEKMREAVDRLMDSLTNLSGVADPVAKALEPLALIADRIAESSKIINLAMRQAGVGGPGGVSSRNAGAILTANAKKDIRVMQEMEVQAVKEKAKADRELRAAFERAQAVATADALKDAVGVNQASMSNLLSTDEKQFAEMLGRTISGLKGNRNRQQQLLFMRQVTPTGSVEDLSLANQFASTVPRGYAFANQMTMTALAGVDRARLTNKDINKGALVSYQGLLGDLIPAERGLADLAVMDAGLAAAQKLAQDADLQLAQYEQQVKAYEKARDQRTALGLNIRNFGVATNDLNNVSKSLNDQAGRPRLKSARAYLDLLQVERDALAASGKQPMSTTSELEFLRNQIGTSALTDELRNRILVNKDDDTSAIDEGKLTTFLAREQYVRDTKVDNLRTQRKSLEDSLSKLKAERDTIVGPTETPEQALQRLEAQGLTLTAELKKLGGMTTPEGVGLQAGRDKLTSKQQSAQADLQAAEKMVQDALAKVQTLMKTPGASRDDLKRAVDELRAKFRELTPEALKAAEAVKKVIDPPRGGGGGGGPLGWLDGMVNKIRSLSQYMFAGGILYSAADQVRRAIATGVEVEYDVKRLQGILDSKSGSESSDILQGTFNAAQATGTDIRTGLQMARIFSQTGVPAPQVEEMTRQALRGQVGAGLEGTQAPEFLIAVENISKGQISSADILDRISRVESQYAVSARDLSVSIQRAGSLAEQLQPQARGAVSALDLVIGASTAVIERTRVSGEQASTSLRFIFSRLLQPRVARDLQERFGVQLGGEEPGSMRPLQDVLGDISQRYRALNASGRTAEASQLLVTFAGARQANAAAALLEDFGKALDVAKESALAYGDTQQRVALQLDTIQAQYQRAQTGFTELITAAITRGPLGRAAKSLLGGIGDSLEDVSDNSLLVGGVATGTAAVGAASGTYMVSRLIGTAFTSMAKSMAARGLASTAVASVGATATGIGPVVAILVGLAAAAWSIYQLLKDDEDKPREFKFDIEDFRSGDMYRGFARQADALGLQPESLTRAVAAASTEANRQLAEKFTAAQLADPQTKESAKIRKAAEEAFIKALGDAIPAFKALSIQEQRSLAPALLNTGFKFLNVPGSEALAQLRTDATNNITEASKRLDSKTQEIEARVRAVADVRQTPQQSLNTVRNWTSVLAQQFSSLGGAELIAGGRSPSDINFTTASGQITNLDAIARGLPNGSTVGQLVGAVNRAVRENLILPSNNQWIDRVQTASTELSVLGQERTSQAILNRAMQTYAESLDVSKIGQQAYNDAMAKARTGMEDVARIAANQDRIINLMMPGLRSRFGLAATSAEVNTKANDLLGYDQSDVSLAQVYKQAMQQALRRLEAELEKSAPQGQAGESIAQIKTLQKQLERAPLSSFIKTLNEQSGLRVARERIFEPYVSYGQQLGEIRVMSGLQQQYGLDYDPMRARFDAALRFRQAVGGNTSRIVGDMVRASFSRLMNGSVDPATLQAAVSQAAGEGVEVSEGKNYVDIGSLMTSASSEEMARADRRFSSAYDQLQKQFDMSQKGLGALVEDLSYSSDGSTREAAQQLATSLQKLRAEFGTYDATLDQSGQKARDLAYELNRLEKEARALSDKDIFRFVENQAKTYQAQRDIASVQASGERRQAELQFLTEMQLARSQALGLRPDALLGDQLRTQATTNTLQRSVLEDTFTARIAEAQRQYDLKRGEGANQLVLDATYQNLLNLTNERDIARLRQDQQGDLAMRRLPEQAINASLQQQTQQITQLVDAGLLSPFKALLMDYKNFSREGIKSFFGAMANAAQEAIVNQFMEQLQFLIQNPIVDSFRSGGLYSKQYIIDAFREGAMQAVQLMAPPASSALPGAAPSPENISAAAGLTSSANSPFSLNPPASALGGAAVLGTSAFFSSGEGTIGSKYFRPQIARQVMQDGGMRLRNGDWLNLSDVGNANVGGGNRPWWGFNTESTLGRLGNAAAPLVGSLGGAALGNVWGKKNNYGQTGASIGSMIGMSLGPLGGLAGGLLGGLIGGLFGGKGDDEPDTTQVLEKIERNTRESVRALENQTTLLNLDGRFLNVPAGFTVPQYRPFGVGGSGAVQQVNNINFTVNAGPGTDPEDIARQVSSAIQRQLSSAGGSYDFRNA